MKYLRNFYLIEYNGIDRRFIQLIGHSCLSYLPGNDKILLLHWWLFPSRLYLQQHESVYDFMLDRLLMDLILVNADYGVVSILQTDCGVRDWNGTKLLSSAYTIKRRKTYENNTMLRRFKYLRLQSVKRVPLSWKYPLDRKAAIYPGGWI